MRIFSQDDMPPVMIGANHFLTALDTCSAALLVSLEAFSRAEAISSFRLPAIRPLFLMPVRSSAGIIQDWHGLVEHAPSLRGLDLNNQQSARHALAALPRVSSKHTCHVEGAA